MPDGRKIHRLLYEAIRLHDRLLLVLSRRGMGASWVRREIRRARRAEAASGKRKLIPIRLVEATDFEEWECIVADTGEDLTAAIRESPIVDFAGWGDADRFEAAYRRLLAVI